MQEKLEISFNPWEDLLEYRMAIHSSILAWQIPWTEEPDGLQFMGSQRVERNWPTEHTPILKTTVRLDFIWWPKYMLALWNLLKHNDINKLKVREWKKTRKQTLTPFKKKKKVGWLH